MLDLIEDARSLFDVAVRAVQPDALLEDVELDAPGRRAITSYRKVFVLGMGKAALATASVIERRIASEIDDGHVVVPHGYPEALPERFAPPQKIRTSEAGHPLPDRGSIHAARSMLRLAAAAGPDDLVIVLISGGGSALCADFFGEITLEDAAATFDLLTEAGIDIHGMNVVRKRLSRIAGGRLALAAHPAEVVSLIISDVVGDDVSVIASGPTAEDSSTIHDAMHVLRTAGIWDDLPARVRRFLQDELESQWHDTLRPGSIVFENLTNRVIGTNASALNAAADYAQGIGYDVRFAGRALAGEARVAGGQLIENLRAWPRSGPVCQLSGGETTVTIRGNGRGGRNQEMALAAALALDGLWGEAVFLSAGSDGIDGPTDAAGAVIDSETAMRARSIGLDPERFLQANDSYVFFDALGGHIKTGPTHTNVMDLQIALIQ